MKKIIVKILPLLLVSSFVVADYKVYSKPQNNGGKVLDVPTPSCVSELSTVPDGFHEVCGHGEVPVVGGVAFEVTPSVPANGFECSNGYANHSEAIGLASLLNVQVYTPYNSYLPVFRAGHPNWAVGRASYVFSDGSYDGSFTFMYGSHLVGQNYKYNIYKYGTPETLVPYENSGEYGQNYGANYDDGITTLVAHRACVLMPN